MNNKRIYENVIILKGTFTQEEYKKSLSEIKEYIEPLEIIKVEEIGKKNLAYEVDKNKEGYFVIFYLKATEQDIVKLEKFYRINSDILKFMTVRRYKR